MEKDYVCNVCDYTDHLDDAAKNIIKMKLESNIKDIKRLVSVLTGKDADVSCTYKGTAYGITKPWHIRCDSREINHETIDGGTAEFVKILREELIKKISDTKKQAAEYEKALGAIEN
jgi:hypothetical protein